MGAPTQARRDSQENFWASVEAATLLFNPRHLPRILVPSARLAKEDKEDPRLNQLLLRATKYLQNDGIVVPPVLGCKGAAMAIQALRELHTTEARNFHLALLGALAAQVAELDGHTLKMFVQEFVKARISDAQLWRSLLEKLQRRDDLEPTDIAFLLSHLRHAADLGVKTTAALQSLCQTAVRRCKEFSSKDLVIALNAISRLHSHLEREDQLKALHLLTDRWLALQPSNLRTTPPNQVISVSVSLASLPGTIQRQLRKDSFMAVVPRWAQTVAIPSGAVSAEESIVLLWTIQNLSDMGLGSYRGLVELALGQLAREARYEEWTVLRLCQALEVLLDAQLVLSAADGGSEEQASPKALASEIELKVAAALADMVPQAHPERLTKEVRKADRGGLAFWVRCDGLADAFLKRAAALAADEAVPQAVAVALLEAIASSELARTAAFRTWAPSITSALSKRPGTEELSLAALREKFAPVEKERPPLEKAEASGQAATDADKKPGKELKSSAFEALPVLSPTALAERLGKLGRSRSSAAEVALASEALLGMLDSLDPGDLLLCLQHVMRAGRRRLAKQPALLEVIERIGDQVALLAKDSTSPQLILALELFAEIGLPYHLLFESTLFELLKRSSSQSLSWGQVVGILESFAAVRVRLPELSHFYRRLRRQQELARMPTMGLIRFLFAATELELTDKASADVKELLSRILAETSPHRPLPLQETATILQSLLTSGTVAPEKQLRHMLAWVAPHRPSQFSQFQLTVLRQYMLFILAQAEETQRSSLLRMPVEMQTFVSEILCSRLPNSPPGIADASRQLRSQVAELVADDAASAMGVGLGPGGTLDLQVGDAGWLLDGSEAFVRPFVQPLDYIAQEKRRLWLLERLLCDKGTRRHVSDFYPPALQWPLLGGVRRLSWLQWEQTPPKGRSQLLGLGPPSLPPGGGLSRSPSLVRDGSGLEGRAAE